VELRARLSAAAVDGTRGWIAVLYLLGLLPRLLLIAGNVSGIEFWEYEALAQSIANGRGYAIVRLGHVTLAFGDGNLYSFLAAVIYLIFGHQPVALAIVQAALASLAAPFIFMIARPAFGWRVAAVAGVLATLHPGGLAYTLKLHPLGLDVLLLALAVFWVQRTSSGSPGILITGLVLGLCLMSQPTFFLAGVAALGLHIVTRRNNVGGIAATLCIAALVAAPWVARNWAIFGRPVFISTALEDVWKGNNPIASGSSLLPTGEAVLSAAPVALQLEFAQADELQLNDIFSSEIVNFVRENPGDFAALTVRKFGYFWWVSPQTGLQYPVTWSGSYQAYFVVLAALTALGAVRILRDGNSDERHILVLLAAISLTIAVIHALTYVEGRHRWGVEPLLLIVSARGICSIVSAAWVTVEHGIFLSQMPRRDA
jgi:hypothetical protein